jgi:hypothetical protein
MGVVGFGQGVGGHVRVEVFPTARASMLRVNELNVARSSRNQIAHVMQDPPAGSTAETRFVTTRTGTMSEVPATVNDLGFGQIFGARNALRDIRQVLSGARHSKALLGLLIWPRKLQRLLV